MPKNSLKGLFEREYINVLEDSAINYTESYHDCVASYQIVNTVPSSFLAVLKNLEVGLLLWCSSGGRGRNPPFRAIFS